VQGWHLPAKIDNASRMFGGHAGKKMALRLDFGLVSRHG
jgi:hypothetical protein